MSYSANITTLVALLLLLGLSSVQAQQGAVMGKRAVGTYGLQEITSYSETPDLDSTSLSVKAGMKVKTIPDGRFGGILYIKKVKGVRGQYSKVDCTYNGPASVESAFYFENKGEKVTMFYGSGMVLKGKKQNANRYTASGRLPGDRETKVEASAKVTDSYLQLKLTEIKSLGRGASCIAIYGGTFAYFGK